MNIDLRGKRIFYVEDNVKNRTIVQMILMKHGAQIGFDFWGRESTIERLQRFGRVDLILLDLMYPNDVTGYDVFQTIRRYPEFNQVPIVAISAADPSIEMPKARAMGFAGYIGKPIDLMKFPAQIEGFIAGEHIWAVME